MPRSADYKEKTDEGPRPTATSSESAPVLAPNEARGGITHHNVRAVLAVSLALVVVVFVVIYVAFFSGPASPPL
jgi:hypothetical protein